MAGFIVQAGAQDPSYLPAIKSAHERLISLDVAREDYRKVVPGLPPALEQERLSLLGHLYVNDPVWVLTQQLQADLEALASEKTKSPADVATMENLKDLLAVAAGFDKRAATREEAEHFAATLRKFVVRRDAAGAVAWAKSR